MKAAWWLLLTLSWSPLAAAPDAMAEPPRVIRYVSLNLLHGGVLSGLAGDGEKLEERLRITTEELRALAPDVIGLQEASVGHGRGNVAERLARALGYHYAFAPVRYFDWSWLNHLTWFVINFREGPGILSRFPIVEWSAHRLPLCDGRFEPRGLTYARLRTPWGDLGVASTHTSPGFCQAPAVAALLQQRRGPLPSVLMGDFNTIDGAGGILTLTNGAGFVDAFRAANPDEPGPTVWQRVEAPVPTVQRRVDFVFLLPGTAAPGRVRESRLVLNTPRRLEDGRVLWPSDHYGVLADIEVFAPTSTGAK
jgi:endonuclease/exonuclease/phosphatase family metal-dependent hydrolase